jgi:hypothetical protein
MLQAQRARAAFIVSACCVGNLQFSANVSAAALQECAARGRSTAHLQAMQSQFARRTTAAATSRLGQVSEQRNTVDAEAPAAAQLQHPRSAWMRKGIDTAGAFAKLARAADISHPEGHSFADIAYTAKVRKLACAQACLALHTCSRCICHVACRAQRPCCCSAALALAPPFGCISDSLTKLCFLQTYIELDRAMAAREHGYHAALLKLLRPEASTKSDLIVGVPAESEFGWPWQASCMQLQV